MSDPVVRAYVIGQTPRPDLTDDLGERFPSVSFEVVGALDDVAPEAIEACSGCPYPLETRLRDGARVVVDAAYVARLLQKTLDAYRGDAAAHLVLCAGPFPELTAPPAPSGAPAALVRPFDAAVASFRAHGYRDLEVLVPFPDQARPARDKWASAGFACRTHVLAGRPPDTPLPEWVADRVEGGHADAVVFDYVGFPSEALRDVADRIEIPLFDLGHLALDVLQELIDMRAPR
jgi:hypothetical protein